MKRTIAVTGAHGKTTTASMAAHALRGAGRDPAFLIGGELRSAQTNAAWGAGEWAVIEADESDRSFLKLARDVAVITNVELDHHATYASLGDLEEAMAAFAEPAELRVVGPGVELASEAVRVGIDDGDLRAERLELLPGRSRFEVEGTTVELPVAGRHNVLNALAALAACRAAGVDATDAARRAGRLQRRRPALRAPRRHAAGRARLRRLRPSPDRGARDAGGRPHAGAGRRLVACFQPHLYSRTRLLARDFGRALALADLVVVVDVYPARERAEDYPGVSGLLVAQAAADAAGGRPVWWLPQLDQAERMLGAELGEGDLLVTLGAGDVDGLARALTRRERRPPESSATTRWRASRPSARAARATSTPAPTPSSAWSSCCAGRMPRGSR